MQDPSKWVFWLALAFISKLLFFLLQIHIHNYQFTFPGFWGGLTVDSYTYLDPIDNFIKTGAYQPDFRMPGYGAIYLPLILIFSKPVAFNVLILIQLILSSVSVYCLALLARKVYKTNFLFYATFYLYAISAYTSLFDTILLTESLSVSVLIITCWYFVKYYENRSNLKILVVGILLCWLAFIKPVFCVLPFLFLAILFYGDLKAKSIHLLHYILLLIPLIIAETSWVKHNYTNYHKFIPLAKSAFINQEVDPTPSQLAAFGEAWGARWYWFNNNSEINWLVNKNAKPLPSYIYTSKFNEDSLKEVQRLLLTLNDSTSLPADYRYRLDSTAAGKLSRFALSIKAEKPFLYYVIAPLKELKAFVLEISPYCKVYLNKYSMLFFNLLYYFVFFMGSLGIILQFRHLFKWSLQTILVAIPLYIIVFHPLLMRFYDNRYFVPAYPFMLICSVYAVYVICKRLNFIKE